MGTHTVVIVSDFHLILRTVVLLTASCAVLGVTVAIASAVLPIAHADQLVGTFTDTFKLGMVAILGLIGGRGGSKA